ncbi:uncharacterized CRM domain-containing protein At3g25440, chloroplastic isoform X2 [Malania oleifera]|uniref:uncharacterized CRM domain-containing protein At3g25440, chloroplastic isoform X2 n=1 Tax=Malania oleifera TaxID=397392 RepID=UPI0025AE0976|nr:uncharacterized CRM domain-containing protein At3g25440, chloroplastic isoform X2 [Malania oleifera]
MEAKAICFGLQLILQSLFLLLRSLRRVSLSSLLKPTSSFSLSSRSITHHPERIFCHSQPLAPFHRLNPPWIFRNLSHGSVNLVISQGKTKFETREVDPPKKEKWKTKKRLKMQRMREKQKRKAANKRDPRRLTVKGKKKQRFANAEERIKYKLEKAKIKEALLIERLERYEVPKQQGPSVKPGDLTAEEQFYMKKMAQKRSNYVPIGRRGIFGGVILNMHMHWKKHETVKVICKPCKPGQVHEYAKELARLSGGTPIQIIGDNTIIFYRGKNYEQPEVMSPIDTLSKKRALEKSKYQQSLESVRRFIAIAEKELELYCRHVALYGDPNDRNPISVLDSPRKTTKNPKKSETSRDALGSDSDDGLSSCSDHELSEPEEFEDEESLGSEFDSHHNKELSGTQFGFTDQKFSEPEEEIEDEDLPISGFDPDGNNNDFVPDDEEIDHRFSSMQEDSITALDSSLRYGHHYS